MLMQANFSTTTTTTTSSSYPAEQRTLPYLIPVPPSPSPSPSPPPSPASSPASSPAAAAATTFMDDLLNRLQKLDLNKDTTHFFNPYYYIADRTFEIEPQAFITVHFDSDHCPPQTSYSGCYKSCLKRQPVFVVIQNSSKVDRLQVPQGCSLLELLTMPEIKSCLLPVTPQSFTFTS